MYTEDISKGKMKQIINIENHSRNIFDIFLLTFAHTHPLDNSFMMCVSNNYIMVASILYLMCTYISMYFGVFKEENEEAL